MTQTIADKPPVHLHWEFHSEAALHDGLYGYAAGLNSAQLVQRYGKERGGKEAGEYDNAVARRLEIDACMERVRDFEQWVLLDCYFRQSRCDEADGWQRVAAVVNCKVNPKHLLRSRAAFDGMELAAVDALWKVHVERRGDARGEQGNA